MVVLALPLTEKTRGILTAGTLAAMKKSALLVNAAHTGLVDLPALAKAIEARAIGGAGLDTTDVGPLPAEELLRKAPEGGADGAPGRAVA